MTPFVAQEPLLARIDALAGRLEQATKAIQAAEPSERAPRGNRRLHEMVGASLIERLSVQLTELKRHRNKVVDGTARASVWSVVNAKACSQLLDESLLYLQAAHSRRSDSDPDLCEIVDQLFLEITLKSPYAGWKSFSVFSAEDSYDKLTDVVRVRYPIVAAWDISVSVHELGHFLSDKMLAKMADGKSESTIKQYLGALAKQYGAQQDGGNINWPVWLEEAFADVFAAFVLGPAFGYSSILLRFDPSHPATDLDGKHPSDAKRVYMLILVLEMLNQEAEPEIAGKLKPSILLLRKYWKDCCEFAGEGERARPVAADQLKLDGDVAMFYGLLKQTAPRIRFRSWTSVVKLQKLFRDPTDGQGTSFTITDLLNAAWLCRVQDPSRAGAIDRRFVELCRERILL